MNNIFIDLFYIVYNQLMFLFSQVDFWLTISFLLFILVMLYPLFLFLRKIALDYINMIKNQYQVADVILIETKAKCSNLKDLISNFNDEHKVVLNYAKEEVEEKLQKYWIELQEKINKIDQHYQQELAQLELYYRDNLKKFIVLQLTKYVEDHMIALAHDKKQLLLQGYISKNLHSLLCKK